MEAAAERTRTPGALGGRRRLADEPCCDGGCFGALAAAGDLSAQRVMTYDGSLGASGEGAAAAQNPRPRPVDGTTPGGTSHHRRVELNNLQYPYLLVSCL